MRYADDRDPAHGDPAHGDPAHGDTEVAGPYGLERPTLSSAYESLRRVRGAAADRLWPELVTAAGLRGDERTVAAVDDLISTMLAADPTTRLVGRALLIRATSHDHLAATRQIIRRAA